MKRPWLGALVVVSFAACANGRRAADAGSDAGHADAAFARDDAGVDAALDVGVDAEGARLDADADGGPVLDAGKTAGGRPAPVGPPKRKGPCGAPDVTCF